MLGGANGEGKAQAGTMENPQDSHEGRDAALQAGATAAAEAAPGKAPAAAVPEPERSEYPSHDGESQIAAYLWLLDDPAWAEYPRGVVQICHGMCEHMLRYADFAAFLTRQGFAVCGNDHIGHGASQPDPDLRGCLPAHTGEDVLLEDAHKLRGIMQERFPDAPYFLFGHSMGSFIARVYLRRHGRGLAGLIVCGTAFMPPAFARAASLFARAIARVRGPRFRSTLVDSLGAGAYAKQVEGARTPFDWLSTDPDVVDAYRADPRCGFMFSAAGYAVLTRLLADACDADSSRKAPHDVPVLVIAGDKDPVGSFGDGPRKCAAQMKKEGMLHVDEIMYEGMRHEILNEPDRMRVYGDALDWIEARCAGWAARAGK